MRGIVFIVFSIMAIVFSVLFIRWVVNADIPLWLKIFILR